MSTSVIVSRVLDWIGEAEKVLRGDAQLLIPDAAPVGEYRALIGCWDQLSVARTIAHTCLSLDATQPVLARRLALILAQPFEGRDGFDPDWLPELAHLMNPDGER